MSRRIKIIDAFNDQDRDNIVPVTGPNGIGDAISSALTGLVDADVSYDILQAQNIAPSAPELAGFDGFIWSGSTSSAYEDSPEVARMTQWMELCSDTSRPVFGICFGLQLAAVVAGGEVTKNPQGRETWVTRKIETTVEGIDHPMFDRRSGSFDATSEHGDAVTGLPPGGKRLAGNDACDVQAAAFQMTGSEVWGTQYHPDIDLPQSRSIAAELRDVLIAEGYFESVDDFGAHVTRLDRLVADPDSKDARWQLGVDDDILKLERQYAEVVCWLEHLIL